MLINTLLVALGAPFILLSAIWVYPKSGNKDDSECYAPL